MATKRSKRIDPNAAFAAIVGTAEPDTAPAAQQPAAGEGTPAPGEGSAGPAAPAGAADLAGPPPAAGAIYAPEGPVAAETAGYQVATQSASQGQPAAVTATPAAAMPPGAPDFASVTSSAASGYPAAPGAQNAPQANFAPSPAAAPVPPEPAAPAAYSGGFPAGAAAGSATPMADAESQPRAALPLVQKGYYITEEQHRKLGMYAVLQGSDRSAIVRQALEMYFDANRDILA